jgi:peroxiredoxin
MRNKSRPVERSFVVKPVFTFAVAILALIAASPAAAALKVGDSAPAFSAPGTQGGTVTTVALSKLLKKGPVVLYFFPSAFTDTTESREFADAIDKFRAAGVSVVGMSRDSVSTLARFSIEQCAGKFPVASADENIVNAFDVNDGAMFNTRTTFVIAPSGKIVFVDDDADSGDHVKKALAFVQGMKKHDAQ